MAWPNDTAVPLPTDWENNYVGLPAGQVVPPNQNRPHWNDWASHYVEKFQRWLLPNGPVEDFAVGWNRILFGTVGSQDAAGGGFHPTWDAAYGATDRQLAGGWLPGGAPPQVPQLLKDIPWGTIAIVGIAAAFVLSGRRR